MDIQGVPVSLNGLYEDDYKSIRAAIGVQGSRN